jgi:uncharacterized membrane protein
MKRIHLFLIITVISMVSLLAVALSAYYVLSASTTQSQSNWMGQMWSGMGGMMGGTNGAQAQVQNSAAPYFGVVFVALIAVALVGIGGMIYFVAFPQIRTVPLATQPILKGAVTQVSTVQAVPEVVAVSPYESVVKTLTIDERKVIEVLKTHGGKYLQKYIRNDAGLSRLQTHRIVARLAERGIVTLEKTGNTNSVLLANWLK